MNYLKVFGLTFFICLHFAADGLAQKKEKVVSKADSVVGVRIKDKGLVRKLYHNVVYTFKKRDAIIYCDSSYRFEKLGLLECYGEVEILEGDSVTVISDFLIYDQRARLAKLRKNVVMDNMKTVLYTDTLDYSIKNSQAIYWGGGRIVDDTNDLTSETGRYDTKFKMAYAGGNVIFKNPTYTLEADSLIYNLRTKQVRTLGYTKVIDSTGVAIAPEGAVYNASIETITALPGTFSTESYEGKADYVYFDQLNKVYIGEKNVELYSQKDSVLITGGKAIMNRLTGKVTVFKEPLMRKIMQKDTFYLKADTLVSIDIPEKKQKELLAYHNVLIYKSNLQGVADSLAYHVNDSLIHMFTDPVLWSQGNQITAEDIKIGIGNDGLKYMDMKSKSFVVMEDSLEFFNQLKGRDMYVTFKNSTIDVMNVNGNSESIFFSVDDKTGVIIGMNYLYSANMRILFRNGQAKEATFLKEPNGLFTPPHELEEPDKYLKSFKWRIDQRPYLNNFTPVNRVEEDPEVKTFEGKIEKKEQEKKFLPINKEKLRRGIPRREKE